MKRERGERERGGGGEIGAPSVGLSFVSQMTIWSYSHI